MRYLVAIALWGCFSLVAAKVVADITGEPIRESFGQITTALDATNR